MAINGDYAIVGAVYEVAPGTGAAYVYTDLIPPPLPSLSTAVLFIGTMSLGSASADSVKVENADASADGWKDEPFSITDRFRIQCDNNFNAQIVQVTFYRGLLGGVII